jgi:hypothetical protein
MFVMKLVLRTVLAVVLLSLGTSIHSYAQSGCASGGNGCPTTPEIDPSMAGADLALLGGVALLIRSRRRQ